MIQRPQTLFLLAVVAICIMLMFSNTVFFIAENIDTGEKIEVEFDETKIYASDGSSQESNTYLVAIAAVIAFLSMAAILLFKNRKMQTLVSSINYLLILGLIIMMYLYSLGIEYFNGTGHQSFTLLALLPMSLLFFNFLAIKGVRKDEKLIRSMDRIR
jgi:hypothetical protein